MKFTFFLVRTQIDYTEETNIVNEEKIKGLSAR